MKKKSVIKGSCLAKGIHGKGGHGRVVVAADGVEVREQDLPDWRPLEANAVHIIMGNFDNLLHAEHARLLDRVDLLQGNGAEALDKLHNGLTIK